MADEAESLAPGALKALAPKVMPPSADLPGLEGEIAPVEPSKPEASLPESFWTDLAAAMEKPKVWRGLLAPLWGSPMVSEATGPEDLAPFVGSLPKGFAEQAYKTTLPVVVRGLKTLEDVPEPFHDAVKGLNRGHALYRARENWPDLDVQAIRDVFRRLMRYDPEVRPPKPVPKKP